MMESSPFRDNSGHADGKRDLKTVKKQGYDKLAVCMAKTPGSLSDNPALLGRPKDFIVTGLS